MDTPVPPLSAGAIAAIIEDCESAKRAHPEPVLQCLSAKRIAAGEQERYRGALGDGVHWASCVFSSTLNEMAREGEVAKGSICRIVEYSYQSLSSGRGVIVVMNLEALPEFGIRELIGNPVRALSSHPRNELPEALAPPRMRAGKVVYPLAGISPFAREWAINVEVTSKSERRRDAKDGEGAFRIRLADRSLSIDAVGCDDCGNAFYELLEVGNVYYFSGPCGIALANRRSTYGLSDFELRLEPGTVIEKYEN